MATYVHLVMVNALEGQDDEFNKWLDGHHIPEVVKSGDMVKCHRFEVAAEEADNPKATKRYMHIYEVETDDLTATIAKLEAFRPQRTPLSPALDTSNIFNVWYKAR